MKLEFHNRELFLNDFRAVSIMEYNEETEMLKQLIIFADEYLTKKQCTDTFSYEGVCYLFAESIVEYSKMAYDNMILGHYDAANMINRTILENNVCLNIIMENQSSELWKYWLVHSIYKSLIPEKEYDTSEVQEMLKEIYENYTIDEEFLEKHLDKKDKRAYIEKEYGWTYKINTNFSFKGLCDLRKEYLYSDFKMMSAFAHGTSVYYKINKSVFHGTVMNMLSCLYYNMQFFIKEYFDGLLSCETYELFNKLTKIFEQSYEGVDIE